MDENNVEHLNAFCPDHHLKKVRLLLEYARDGKISEVPDPYQGKPKDFEQVLDLIEEGCRGLVDHVIEVRRVLAKRRNRSPFKE